MKGIETLYAAVRTYSAEHPEEREVAGRFLTLLGEGHIAFTREREEGHLTASAWVTDPTAGAVLLLYHRKLEKWLQPGGHADGETNLLSVAMREVEEETGLATVNVQGDRILDLDIHLIPERKGVPSHYHYDVRFLLHGDAMSKPRGNHENLEVRWVGIEEVESLTSEESILRMRRKAAGR